MFHLKEWEGWCTSCRWAQQISADCSFSFLFNLDKSKEFVSDFKLIDSLEKQAQALKRQTAVTENAHPGKYLSALGAVILVKQKLILKRALGYKRSQAS